MKKKFFIVSTFLIIIFSIFLIINNNSNEKLLKKSLTYASNEDYKEALEILNIIESKEKNKPTNLLKDIYKNKAICLYKLKDYEESIIYINKTLDMNDSLIIEHLMVDLLLSAYKSSEQFDKIIETGYLYIDKYGNNNDFSIKIYDHIFDAYIELEEYEKALNINSLLKKLDPENVYHYLGTIFVYNYIKDPGFIVEYIEDCLKIFPNNNELLHFHEYFSTLNEENKELQYQS